MRRSLIPTMSVIQAGDSRAPLGPSHRASWFGAARYCKRLGLDFALRLCGAGAAFTLGASNVISGPRLSNFPSISSSAVVTCPQSVRIALRRQVMTSYPSALPDLTPHVAV